MAAKGEALGTAAAPAGAGGVAPSALRLSVSQLSSSFAYGASAEGSTRKAEAQGGPCG